MVQIISFVEYRSARSIKCAVPKPISLPYIPNPGVDLAQILHVGPFGVSIKALHLRGTEGVF